jgi:ribosomal protein S25
MPPKVQQKSKEAKMAAAMAGGKSKKKKWSKGKVRIASGFVLSFPPRAEITLSC